MECSEGSESPSLYTLKGSWESDISIKSIPKDPFLIDNDEVVAFKRRESCRMDDIVNKLVILMIQNFVEYCENSECVVVVGLEKEKFVECSAMSLVREPMSLDKAVHRLLAEDKKQLTKIPSKITPSFPELTSQNSKLTTSLAYESTMKVPSAGGLSKMGVKRSKKRLTTLKSLIKRAKGEEEDEVKESVDPEDESAEEEEGKKKVPIKREEPIETIGIKEWMKMISDKDQMVKIFFKNGNVYEGRISCFMMEGKATYRWNDGTQLQGLLVGGVAQGPGHIEWPGGSWYDGCLKNNLRHGRGICTLLRDEENKLCYYGEWKYGSKNGKGMLLYGQNNWYDGEWKNGLRDGYGLRQYPSGARYLGFWERGKQNGFGMMVWANADMYSGDWKDGKMDGCGTYTWNAFKNNMFVAPMQNYYQGEWKNGKRHGHGRMLHAGGAVVTAVWVDGMKQGPGEIICKNGLVISSPQLFSNDRIINVGEPLQIPSWNQWYREFLSTYQEGLYQKTDVSEHFLKAEDCINNIPLLAPVETTPLWKYIERVVGEPIEDLRGEKGLIFQPEDDELMVFEEMWLRRTIIKRMPDISYLYYHYAVLGCTKKPNFKPALMRLMLWQMCLDSGLDQCPYNLTELDQIVGGGSYPFDIVLQYEMLHYMLNLTNEICLRHKLVNPEIPGKWGGAFDYFITHFALPGTRNTSGIMEICKKLPLRALYSLYESLGQPLTIRQLLNKIVPDDLREFTVIPQTPEKLLSKLKGTNVVYPDGSIFFETDPEPGLEFMKIPSNYVFSQVEQADIKDLGFLGYRAISKILVGSCPKATDLGGIPSGDYKIPFLEFCRFLAEALLLYRDKIEKYEFVSETEVGPSKSPAEDVVVAKDPKPVANEEEKLPLESEIDSESGDEDSYLCYWDISEESNGEEEETDKDAHTSDEESSISSSTEDTNDEFESSDIEEEEEEARNEIEEPEEIKNAEVEEEETDKEEHESNEWLETSEADFDENEEGFSVSSRKSASLHEQTKETSREERLSKVNQQKSPSPVDQESQEIDEQVEEIDVKGEQGEPILVEDIEDSDVSMDKLFKVKPESIPPDTYVVDLDRMEEEDPLELSELEIDYDGIFEEPNLYDTSNDEFDEDILFGYSDSENSVQLEDEMGHLRRQLAINYQDMMSLVVAQNKFEEEALDQLEDEVEKIRSGETYGTSEDESEGSLTSGMKREEAEKPRKKYKMELEDLNEDIDYSSSDSSVSIT